jgi:hypothetical protein
MRNAQDSSRETGKNKYSYSWETLELNLKICGIYWNRGWLVSSDSIDHSGGLLGTWYWTFDFHKRRRHFLINWAIVRFKKIIILSRDECDYRRGLLVIGLIELLQLLTANKNCAVTVLHNSQITIGHTMSTQSLTVFTSRCLIAAFNDGCSPFCVFRSYHRCHLPASHNSLQQLNSGDYLLTDSLTHRPSSTHTDGLTLSKLKWTLC